MKEMMMSQSGRSRLSQLKKYRDRVEKEKGKFEVDKKWHVDGQMNTHHIMGGRISKSEPKDEKGALKREQWLFRTKWRFSRHQRRPFLTNF